MLRKSRVFNETRNKQKYGCGDHHATIDVTHTSRMTSKSKGRTSRISQGGRRSQIFTRGALTGYVDNVPDNVSDITYRGGSRTCFKRGCCIEKEKIMNKINSKNKRQASKVRQSSIMAATNGAASQRNSLARTSQALFPTSNSALGHQRAAEKKTSALRNLLPQNFDSHGANGKVKRTTSMNKSSRLKNR